MTLKTVTLYGADGGTIIVNDTDVEKFKELGFSRRKKAESVTEKPRTKKEKVSIEE